MAKVKFSVAYSMKFPGGSSVAKGPITLDDVKHKDLVELLDASKGASRVEAKEEAPASKAEAPAPKAEAKAEPKAEPKAEAEPAEPEWQYMQKTELKKWLSGTGVKMPRENASHKSLVAACAKAWAEGSR